MPHGFSAPVQIGTDTDWLLTQAGADRCALKTDGSLYCWGRGSIGDGDLWKAEPTLVVASP